MPTQNALPDSPTSPDGRTWDVRPPVPPVEGEERLSIEYEGISQAAWDRRCLTYHTSLPVACLKIPGYFQHWSMLQQSEAYSHLSPEENEDRLRRIRVMAAEGEVGWPTPPRSERALTDAIEGSVEPNLVIKEEEESDEYEEEGEVESDVVDVRPTVDGDRPATPDLPQANTFSTIREPTHSFTSGSSACSSPVHVDSPFPQTPLSPISATVDLSVAGLAIGFTNPSFYPLPAPPSNLGLDTCAAVPALPPVAVPMWKLASYNARRPGPAAAAISTDLVAFSGSTPKTVVCSTTHPSGTHSNLTVPSPPNSGSILDKARSYTRRKSLAIMSTKRRIPPASNPTQPVTPKGSSAPDGAAPETQSDPTSTFLKQTFRNSQAADPLHHSPVGKAAEDRKRPKDPRPQQIATGDDSEEELPRTVFGHLKRARIERAGPSQVIKAAMVKPIHLAAAETPIHPEEMPAPPSSPASDSEVKSLDLEYLFADECGESGGDDANVEPSLVTLRDFHESPARTELLDLDDRLASEIDSESEYDDNNPEVLPRSPRRIGGKRSRKRMESDPEDILVVRPKRRKSERARRRSHQKLTRSSPPSSTAVSATSETVSRTTSRAGKWQAAPNRWVPISQYWVVDADEEADFRTLTEYIKGDLNGWKRNRQAFVSACPSEVSAGVDKAECQPTGTRKWSTLYNRYRDRINHDVEGSSSR